MSKHKKGLGNPNQLTIFDLIKRLSQDQAPANQGQGSLNIQVQLQGTITECIKRCPLSRWEIAGRMSTLLNHDISKYMLDTWTAESKEYHRFPAEYLPAFCHAVGSHEPLRLLAEKAGAFILPGPDALRSEIQKIEQEIKDLQKRRLKRLTFLEEMDGKETRTENNAQG